MLLLACWLACCAATPAQGQAPLYLVNDSTTIASIGFQFLDGEAFTPAELRQQIASTQPGALYGVRKTIGKLPLIPGVPEHPFFPIELQKDLARLRQYYYDQGFPQARVTYEVQLDSVANTVHIDFLAEQGPSLLVEQVTLLGPAGLSADVLHAELPQDVLRELEAELPLQPGDRLTQPALIETARRAGDWLRNRGYAFARVDAVSRLDSLDSSAVVRLQLDPGPKARVGRIEIQGNQTVADRVVRRELPFHEGDVFSHEKLIAGQRQLARIGLFQTAIVDLPEQPMDDSVRVRVQVNEAKLRSVKAQTGYHSAFGITLQASWSHRNWLGRAESLAFTLLAETGLLRNSTAFPERRYRGTLSLLQPHFFRPKLSATLAPYAEYRDNQRDESWAVGSDASLIYALGGFRTLSLRYSLETRRILQYRVDDFIAGNQNILDLFQAVAQGQLDTLGTRINKSTFTLTATWGNKEDPFSPRSGFALQPYAEVTAPPFLTTIEYVLLGANVAGYLPILPGVRLVGKVRGSRILPFGKSDLSNENEDEALVNFLQLRDVILFGGGSNDVRGWQEGMLGPKLPDFGFQLNTSPDTSVSLVSNRYIPFGGTAKLSSQFELQLPLPFMNRSWGTHLFFDVGRIWSPEDSGEDVDPQEPDIQAAGFFYATGAGIDYHSAVGTFQISLGYMLNPSFFDVREPQSYWNAVLIERPVTLIEPNWRQRFNLHITISQTF